MKTQYKITLTLVIIICLIVGSFFLYKKYKTSKEEKAVAAQEEKAKKEFAPILQLFDAQIEQSKDSGTYDIDKTIRVIHEIDNAVKNTNNIQDYLMALSKEDYRNVSPDVLKARKNILATIMQLYGKQTELKDQPDFWEIVKEFSLATGSGIKGSGIMGVDGGFLPSGDVGMKYDPEMVKKTYENYLESKKMSAELKQQVREIKSNLLEQIYNYSTVYYNHYDAWDKVCLHRDKAYLAMKNAMWDDVLKESEEAIKLAPHEKEAHILKAAALLAISNRNSLKIESTPTENPLEFLDNFIQKNPDYSAPALLLKGVYFQQQGNVSQAKLMYEESAAYYPKQAEHLTSMFNPYKMRNYLRKTKEGNAITEMYTSTMLGAGYFTPDLQLARMYIDAGDAAKGREKILDHFSRRRNQSQWDYIISDITFCEKYIGAEFNKILPENFFLVLNVDASTFGSKLNLSVKNNSSKRLSNASLILCIQYTDMMRDDYVTHKVSKTLPAILPYADNDFGTEEITYNLFGKEKTVDDIVYVRAILISDEAVNWVDSDEFKYENIKRQREQLKQLPKTESTQDIEISKIKDLLSSKANQLYFSSSNLSIYDELELQIPRDLANYKPIFRITSDGKNYKEPAENVLTDKNVSLKFKLNKLDTKDQNTYKLTVYTSIGVYTLTYAKDASGKFILKNTTAS